MNGWRWVDVRGALIDAMVDLPTKQRAVLILRYWADLDDSIIASIVGCRRATVRSLAARGLVKLRTGPRIMTQER